MDSDTTVKVAVRIRPLLDHELSQQCSICVRGVPGLPQIVVGSDQNFTFDYVYDIDRRQDEVAEECVEPLVDALFEGFNATILAYGQTGSGKTYTMGSASSKRLSGEALGIIPRAIQTMFDTISEREETDHNCTFRLRVQFLEIYGEDIRDLLDPSSSSKVSIRETAGGSVYVSGAREELVTSTEESMMALERGSMSRMTASTRMNETSSRSHGIFTVILEQTLHTRALEAAAAADDEADRPTLELNPLGASTESKEKKPPQDDAGNSSAVDFSASRTEPEVRKCKFHFVDLAGSERVKRTGAEGVRLREGIDINKGLLVLGNVISALGDEQKRGKVHVPYRDSKLTRMLQDSLGGNSKTLMICCVSPADSNYYESLNALKYANRARNIQNKPRVNIDPTVQLLSELRKHVQCLAAEVILWRDAQGIDSPPLSPGPGAQSVPFVISKELLCNLASSGGGTAKMLLSNVSHSTGPATSSGTGTRSPNASAAKNTRGTNCSASSQHGNTNATLAHLAQVNNAAIAADNLAARKQALEHEATIFTLKQKVSDAESEVHRLTEATRRHRQHASDVAETNALLQSERDYYKLKLRDAGIPLLAEEFMGNGQSFREDFSSEQPDRFDPDSSEYATASSVLATSRVSAESKDDQTVVQLLARYILEIETLKSKNRSQSLSSQQHNFSSFGADSGCEDGALDLSNVTTTMFGMDSIEPMGASMFDSNVTVLENDLTSSVARVISQTQRELHKEQQRLLSLRSAPLEGQMDIPSADSREFGDDIAVTTTADTDDTPGEGGQPGAEVEAQDRAFRRRQQDMSSEVVGLSNSIQLKEQLLLQLQRSQRQYEMMKLFYESKLVSLEEEVNQTEAEKLKVSAELEQLSLRTDRTLDKEEDLKVKLRQKDSELRVLHRKQKELTHHSQVQSRSLNQISKLESDIEHMKRTRVDLTKRIHVEKKKHLAALNQKAREIEKLKSELNKTSAEIKKVSREKERAENRTREALKEGADLRRKVHEISRVSPALTSGTASSVAKTNKRVKPSGVGASTWGSNTSYRSATKRLLSEDELKTKRYLDKALQKIAERERAADALRQQYEQQLSLMNQKKQLESSRSSIRDLVTASGTADGVVQAQAGDQTPPKPLSAVEEDALQEVEERIQNLEGQLISRKVRIQSMQTELSRSGKKGSKGGDTSDSTMEYLQSKSADSLPAAHDMLRLLFDMLVASKCSTKSLTETVETLKEKERHLKEQHEDEIARIHSLMFAHDQELTRMHSDYEEKLSGLLSYSDINQLLMQGDLSNPENDAMGVDPSGEHSDRRYSRLLHAVTAEIFSFDESSRGSDLLQRARSDSGGVSGGDGADGPGGKGNPAKVRALLALSHEKNAFLSNALTRESSKVSQLQADLDEMESARKKLAAQLESKEYDLTFLNEECRMLRDLADEYKDRVLALEGGQGVGIVRTIDQLDKQKRGEKGMDVRYGDDPDNSDEPEPAPVSRPTIETRSLSPARGRSNTIDDDDESLGGNSVDFGVLTDEINKSGSFCASVNSDGTSGPSNVSIFDRLANPSYFTGTQKKLFQKDLETKRAMVKKVKKEETVKKKKDGATFKSLSDDESVSSHLQKESEDVDDRSDDEDVNGEKEIPASARRRNSKLLKLSSFSTDDLDIGTHRENCASSSSASDFQLHSGSSFEGGTHVAQTPSAAAQGGDVFSRLLNPTKFTGIHKVTGLALNPSSTKTTSPMPSPRNSVDGGGDSVTPDEAMKRKPSKKGVSAKHKGKSAGSADLLVGASRSTGKQFHV